MGRSERQKGASGEREIVNLLKGRGLKAQRTAPLQASRDSSDADVLGVEGMWLEIKRRERVSIDAWCTEAEAACPASSTPCVVWRRSRQPWRVALSLDDFLDLVEAASS